MKNPPKFKWLVWPAENCRCVIWLCLVWIASYQILNWTPPPLKPYTPWASLLALFSTALVWLLNVSRTSRTSWRKKGFPRRRCSHWDTLKTGSNQPSSLCLKTRRVTCASYIFLPDALAQLADVELQTTRTFITNQNCVMGEKTVTYGNGQRAASKLSSGARRHDGNLYRFPQNHERVEAGVDYTIPATNPAARDELEKKLVRRFNESSRRKPANPIHFYPFTPRLSGSGSRLLFTIHLPALALIDGGPWNSAGAFIDERISGSTISMSQHEYGLPRPPHHLGVLRERMLHPTDYELR